MTRYRALVGLVAAVLVAAVSGAGCGGKKRPPVLTTAQGSGGARSGADHGGTGTERLPSESGPDVNAVDREGALGADFPSHADATSETSSPLADIQFDFDSYALTESAKATLEKHAGWLQGHRDVKVTVEGHWDERGTVEYNLALGDKRARAAHDYLVSLGVAGDRLSAISLGKERPLDPGHDEAAWAKNRRGHFVVTRR
jgi:peptidoglycan-associated lipoprotein